MDFVELAKQVAKIGLPLLGAVLPIPGGAAIGTALASAIGSPSAAPADILATLTSSAEAVQKAKEFEATHQERMLDLQQQHELGMFQAEVDDRKSARERQTATKDHTNTVLAYTVVGAFIAMIGATLLGYAKVESVLAGTLVGYLSAKAEQVLAYYFGSSKSSDRKTELLSQAPAVPK